MKNESPFKHSTSVQERLAVTFRFLNTSESFSSLKYRFRTLPKKVMSNTLNI